MTENANLTPTQDTPAPELTQPAKQPANINLRVDTALLRAVLDANPTAKLSIESVAIEKMSEEIFRKIRNMDFGQIQRDADARVQRAMADSEAAFRHRYKFPNEAVVEVQRTAKEFFDRELRVARTEFIAAAEKEIQNKLNIAETILAGKVRDIKDSIAAELVQLIRVQARAEFVTVLQEVKSLS
jgi:hypothetical protein